MAANAIGTGAVVLTANADQLLVGMKKAEAATESWAARTRLAAGKAASAIGGKIGGGANEVFGVAKDRAKQMATDFAVEGGRAFLRWYTGTERLNRFLEGTERHLQNITAMTDRLANIRMERIDSWVRPKDVAGELDLELQRGEKERSALLESIKLAEEERDKLNDFNFRTQGLRIAGNLDRFQGAADAVVDTYRDQLNKLNSRLLDMSERRGRILNPERDPAKIGELNRLIENTERQIAAMGKAEHQIKALEMAADGYSKSQIASFEFYADKLKKTTEGFEHVANAVGMGAGIVFGADADKFKEVTDEIKRQGDTIGFTANQIQLYDLKMKGFADRQIKEIEKLQNSTELLVNTFGIASSIANGVKDTKLESGGPILSGAALGRSFEAHTAVANFRASNAIAGGSIGDNPVQIARETLKVLKNQDRNIRQLIDIMKGGPTLKVVV